eukprot:UN23417
MICPFKTDLSNIKDEFIDLHMFKRKETLSVNLKISTKLKVAGNFMPEQFPDNPDPENPFYDIDEFQHDDVPGFPRFNVCMSGLHNLKSVYWALEWVIHHFSIGANHLFIGVYHRFDSEAWIAYTNLFQYWIKRGKITLIQTYIKGIWVADHSQYREFFDNECLYYSKIRGELVGVWDIDETIMPHSLGNIREMLRDDILAGNTTDK